MASEISSRTPPPRALALHFRGRRALAGLLPYRTVSRARSAIPEDLLLPQRCLLWIVPERRGRSGRSGPMHAIFQASKEGCGMEDTALFTLLLGT